MGTEALQIGIFPGTACVLDGHLRQKLHGTPPRTVVLRLRAGPYKGPCTQTVCTLGVKEIPI